MTDPTHDEIEKSSVNETDPALEAAYAAVFEVIRQVPPQSSDEWGQACENARVWGGVQAALDTFQLHQRPHIVAQVLYDNLKQQRDEAQAEVQVLQDRIAKVREIAKVHLDCEPVLAALVLAALNGEGGEAPSGNLSCGYCPERVEPADAFDHLLGHGVEPEVWGDEVKP